MKVSALGSHAVLWSAKWRFFWEGSQARLFFRCCGRYQLASGSCGVLAGEVSREFHCNDQQGFVSENLAFSGCLESDNDNDNDNDTLREVPHPSNEGLALQARVSGP